MSSVATKLVAYKPHAISSFVGTICCAFFVVRSPQATCADFLLYCAGVRCWPLCQFAHRVLTGRINATRRAFFERAVSWHIYANSRNLEKLCCSGLVVVLHLATTLWAQYTRTSAAAFISNYSLWIASGSKNEHSFPNPGQGCFLNSCTCRVLEEPSFN